MDTIELLVCSECGHTAKIRYRTPANWVECRNKMCRKTTHKYVDYYGARDPEAVDYAVMEWNYINDPEHPMRQDNYTPPYRPKPVFEEEVKEEDYE